MGSAFELGLRRDGAVVESFAPNYLVCVVSVVFYRYALHFYDFALEGIHPLLWTHGGVVSVGAGNLLVEDVAGDCVDTFANEWLRQNPPR